MYSVSDDEEDFSSGVAARRPMREMRASEREDVVEKLRARVALVEGAMRERIWETRNDIVGDRGKVADGDGSDRKIEATVVRKTRSFLVAREKVIDLSG